MSYIHSQRKRSQATTDAVSGHTIGPGPSMEALIAGTANPTAAQKGRPFDLDAAMKAKMEKAFGDLSAVRFYESPAVGEAGAEASPRAMRSLSRREWRIFPPVPARSG